MRPGARGTLVAMRTPFPVSLLLAATLLLAAACARNPFRSPADECRALLDKGYADLERVDSPNPSAAVDIARAVGLLSAATFRRQFEKYPECIDQAGRAHDLLRPYIR